MSRIKFADEKNKHILRDVSIADSRMTVSIRRASKGQRDMVAVVSAARETMHNNKNAERRAGEGKKEGENLTF